MRDKSAFRLAWLLALVLIFPLAGHATTLEDLVTPGPVIEGHAKFESECGKCHQPFSKTKQSSLCVACHKETGADITKELGFHGRIKNIATTECKQCHTEHEGRSADIVKLDRETFDHGATDFILKGAHTRATCRACHAPKTKFRQAPATCIACHKADNRHKGRRGEKCSNCHTTQTWSEPRFDHGRTTKFTLTGRHREILCAGCHVNERYKDTPKECNACHRLEDIHGGRFGNKCDKCHTTTSWRKFSFDQKRQSKFPHNGAHASVSCRSCHSKKIFGDKIDTACISCHRNDDEHKGRNGAKCESCHSVVSWSRPRFNHDKDTKFPLRGSHVKLVCEACHKGALKEKLSATCNACHQRDDVHKGRLGAQCGRCHNPGGWANKIFFDHDLTRFPLIGLHAVVPCEECHLAATYKGTTLECMDCHEKSDTHKRRLGTQCGSCHNPNGWAFWRFDHNTRTKFALDGKHEGLQCHACHRKPVRKEVSMPSSCNNCHSGNDVHNRRFGTRCERCHVTSSFKKSRLTR